MISINYQKHILKNGLQVLLHQDSSVPFVAVNVWYHVGSKNEQRGKTGFAHLFEHVMFEGSKNHNKSYFEPLEKIGASINGSTNADRTNYWVNLPSNYLELALWLESDRMGFLLDALDQSRFDIQREVVKNERRQSYENRPYGNAYLMLQPEVFPLPHPYNWPTIGSQEDLDNASLEDVKDFFRTFYVPSNASLAIAGDIDLDSALNLIEKNFGDLPPGKPISRMNSMESPLSGTTTLVTHDNVQLERLYCTWPTTPAFNKHEPALDLLAVILGQGKSSRLHRKLVHDGEIAKDVSVASYSQEIAGEFIIQVTTSPNKSTDQIAKYLNEEIELIAGTQPDTKEMDFALNQVRTQYVKGLEKLGGFGGVADQLNYFNVIGNNPDLVSNYIDVYQNITAKDVSNAAEQFLGDKKVELKVLPIQNRMKSKSSFNRSKMPRPSKNSNFAAPIPSRLKLQNGLQILGIERPKLPMVAFGLYMPFGSISDPEGLPGLLHYVTSMLQEGTSKHTSKQIAELLEHKGASISTHVRENGTIIWAECLKSSFAEIYELFSEIILDPTFPKEDMERIRRQKLTDLARISDDANAIAGRAAKALMFGLESPLGHPIYGTEDSVGKITRTDLISCHETLFGPKGSILLSAGDFDMDDVLKMSESLFGDWKNQSKQQNNNSHLINDNTKGKIHLINKPDAPQSVIMVGQALVKRTDPDYLPLTIFNQVLGGEFSSRLNSNLRQDKGYSYGYMSSIKWLDGPSPFFAGGSVQTEVTRESLIETFKEFSDIRDKNPVTDTEFNDAVNNVLRGLPSNFETISQLVDQMSNIALYGLPDDYYSHYPQDIAKVKIEDVQRVAHKYMESEPDLILVVGDKVQLDSKLQDLGYEIIHTDNEGRPL
jgi:predicted Zn-dependent peptidase